MRMTHQPRRLIAGLLILAGAMPPALPAGEPDSLTLQQEGRSYVPPKFAEGELQERVAYLGPHRDWERLDIWLPKARSEPAAPCAVFVYGGGYGGKRCLPPELFKAFLSRGWVVAQPDYTLGNPHAVPMSQWDVAASVRWLRVNAKRYGIDPERFAVLGVSAGGWIIQDHWYASAQHFTDLRSRHLNHPKSFWAPLPMREMHPVLEPDVACNIQAAVSDWGAQHLWRRVGWPYGHKTAILQPWIQPAAPPLLTYFGPKDETSEGRSGAPSATDPVPVWNPVLGLKALGVPARGLYDHPGITHGGALAFPQTELTAEDGRKTVFLDALMAFLDEQVVKPTVATAPEALPGGGAIQAPTPVRLLSVHAQASIYYTLDGSTPTTDAPVYGGQPITVNPGQTLKAIAVRKGLKPSRVLTCAFPVSDRPVPVLHPLKDHYQATVGKTITIQPEADDAQGAIWGVIGIGTDRNPYWDPATLKITSPPKDISCDPVTGKITVTPTLAMSMPIAVLCFRPLRNNNDPEVVDVRTTVIVVKPATDSKAPTP